MPTHYEGSAQEVRALNAFLKFARAFDSFSSRLLQGASFGDLTPSQFSVMEALYYLGPLSQGQISGKLLKSGSNITLIVDNLEKRGLVRRRREEKDRRVITVSLTDKGRRCIAEVLPQHVATITQEMAVLTAEEQETLGRLCRILGTKERK